MANGLMEPQANERCQPLQGGLEPAPTPTGAAARATHRARALPPLKDGSRSPHAQQTHQTRAASDRSTDAEASENVLSRWPTG